MFVLKTMNSSISWNRPCMVTFVDNLYSMDRWVFGCESSAFLRLIVWICEKKWFVFRSSNFFLMVVCVVSVDRFCFRSVNGFFAKCWWVIYYWIFQRFELWMFRFAYSVYKILEWKWFIDVFQRFIRNRRNICALIATFCLVALSTLSYTFPD